MRIVDSSGFVGPRVGIWEFRERPLVLLEKSERQHRRTYEIDSMVYAC